MVSSFNFKIKGTGPLSILCLDKGLNDFESICNYVQSLPYGRNTDRSNYHSVLNENKGTCSTKHAFLKQVAIEQNALHIQFYLGIYKMQEHNTKGVGKVLSNYNLNYIPEAHTYLKFNNHILDFTRHEESNTFFKEFLLLEKKILPEQIGNYKIEMHKNYIKTWRVKENIPYAFEELWLIREACISALST
jgi:hypothetical protein